MWESTVRLVGDDEAAHKALTQLKKAIRSRVVQSRFAEERAGRRTAIAHEAPTWATPAHTAQ